MTTKSTPRTLAMLAALLLPGATLPSLAHAQNETPAAPAGGHHFSQPVGPRPATMTGQVEQRINQLHAQLKITPEQQAQWDQFAQVMRDNAQSMQQAFQTRGASLASMTAVEDMQSYSQIAQTHAENMQKLTAAFQTLYSSMPDAQKKNADMVFHARAVSHQAAKQS